MRIGLGLGLTQGGQTIRPEAQILADFIRDRYRGAPGPGLLDLFDFAAAGNRTYVNALGHVMTAAINEPRSGHHAYDAGLGQWMPVGLLQEPAGQNDINWSEDLSNWDTSALSSLTASGTIAGLPAWEIVDSDAVTYRNIAVPMNPVTGINTVSVKVRKAVAPTALFACRTTWNDGGSKYAGMSFNAQTGVVTSKWDADGKIAEGVVDQGDHWIAWYAYDSTTFTATSLEIFPSYFDMSGSDGGAHTGTQVVTAVMSEPGHIPGGSSYIKTTGTPLARARDSLELSPLTLAKLLVRHNRAPNLVQDGAWTLGSNWTDTAGDLTHAAGSTSNAKQTGQGVEAGATYLVEYDITDSDDAGFVALRLGDIGTNQAVTTPGDNGSYALLAVADTVDDSFALHCDAALTATFTNIRLRKVAMPTRILDSAEIQDLTLFMAGSMTYVDEDAFSTVVPLSWTESGSNFIEWRLSTSGSASGKFYAVQKTNDVQTAVQQADAQSLPGANVPFSWAAYHSNAGVNLSHDGTLRVAVLTPNLPDLAGSPIQFAPTGIVTLARFGLILGASGDRLIEGLSK
ncbi:hypothetical protein EBB79_09185 [Parasedimentitalea marina]|uniref:Uncharacterized protein n=1 Tax=Parasedimentitalea marina TaxID=2483033 RepID=A0A3T0N1Y3_9RHOB|nr:hypothetical protein [Parasedimentitalea marina]AZV78048.1 hypothetical protein EBB79_09185 [Parasedimentitalea marina]